ncbi:MAG: ABC transporter permease, partial [Solirubrobacteraceae bacterium]
MATYIVRRILWGILLIVLVSALTFILFDVLPSVSPAILRAGRNSSPKTIAYINKELGLDKPIYTQFFDYMKGIFLHFNFGYS